MHTDHWHAKYDPTRPRPMWTDGSPMPVPGPETGLSHDGTIGLMIGRMEMSIAHMIQQGEDNGRSLHEIQQQLQAGEQQFAALGARMTRLETTAPAPVDPERWERRIKVARALLTILTPLVVLWWTGQIQAAINVAGVFK